MKTPILEVVGIKKSYGKKQVLGGISFSMNQGEVLSIIGSSGGGKTTLLRSLNFLEVPDEGRITVDGETVFDASWVKKHWRNLWWNKFNKFIACRVCPSMTNILKF